MTLPAMQRLRERFPKTTITLLTQEKLQDLWRGQPSIDNVITLGPSEKPWTVGRRLRVAQFDTALVLPNSGRSALEPWFAGIPNRLGYASEWRRWFLTDAVRFPEQFVRLNKRSSSEVKHLVNNGASAEGSRVSRTGTHQIHHYLHLAAALGCDPSPVAPKLEIGPCEVDLTLANFPELGNQSGGGAGGQEIIWLGLNTSAAYGPAKCWPLDRFAAVARSVSASLQCVWLNFGTNSDWEQGEQLNALTEGRVINLAGKTSLRQLMALLKRCRALLTNDSGPMHLAAALGTPVIVPFGSTSPELTGPGLGGEGAHRMLRATAPCSPCFRRTCPIDFRCMTGISVEQMVAAVHSVLAQQSAGKRS
jgi:heptosyltransferase-2